MSNLNHAVAIESEFEAPPESYVSSTNDGRGKISGFWETKPQVTAAESIIDLLCSIGIDTFFGVPGGPVIPVFDAILTHPDATLIESRHEAYGAFSAMGFYRATGRVPAVIVTAGPGATNVITGVVSAHYERVPMLIICGDVPWATTGKRLLQQTGGDGIGLENMLSNVTRACVRIAHGDSASSQVHAAIEAATNPANPGPALVLISVDRSGSVSSPPKLFSPPIGAKIVAKPPEMALIDRVVWRLRMAEHPLIVLGAGVRNCAQSIKDLIDAAGVPFMTTPQAKGIVPETHPLSLRTSGMGAAWWARRYAKAGCDVTLAIGTDLDDVSMAGTPPLGPEGYLIHVDTDASVLARNYPTALGIVFDAQVFAEHLAGAMIASGGPIPNGRTLIQEIREQSTFDAPNFAEDDTVPIAPHRVIADLERAAGENAVFVSDIGEHMLFALHYLTAKKPDQFVIHIGLGSMGSGISSAVGLALGQPQRRVVCICGDGGMQMAGMEILVAIKHRLPIVYAVFNDARYNMVYHGYRYTFQREAEWSTPFVDFAKWAESLGARGHRIDQPGQITPELLDELTRDGLPVVLDIHHNASIRIKGDGRIEAIQQMSLMHQTKEFEDFMSLTA